MNSINQLKVEFVDGVVVILLTALFVIALIMVIASRRERVSSENSTDTIEKLQNRVSRLEIEVQRLNEENKKKLQVKKLECASIQISPKGDLFKTVKNGYMLEETINFLLHENQSLKHALAVRIYFYKQNVNYLEKENIFLEKNRGIQILSEENEKIYTVKKLQISTLQVSPKEDLFKTVKNIALLEEAIIKLYDTNNYLEDKIEELRTEKESLINEVEKLLMELGELFSYKEKE